MPDEVYLLLGFDRYYPGADNTIAVFDDEGAATIAQEVLSESWRWEDEIWDTFHELFDWWPKYSSTQYSVASHEIRGVEALFPTQGDDHDGDVE